MSNYQGAKEMATYAAGHANQAKTLAGGHVDEHTLAQALSELAEGVLNLADAVNWLCEGH